MTIDINDLNSENTLGKRFYLRDNGRIIYKYDCYDDRIKELTEDQDIIIEDNNIPYALPESWYYARNCPSYIIVRDVALYDTENYAINKVLFPVVSAQTLGNSIAVSFQIKHNLHKYINESRNLTNENQLNDVTTRVLEGNEDTFTAENIPVHIEGLGDYTVNITNGKGTLLLDGTNITSTYLTGNIQLSELSPYYFSLSDIQLIDSIATVKKTEVMREERNRRLADCDWLIIRHITQKDIEAQTSLTDSQIASVEQYMQALRDLPENIEDIDNIEWPVNPLDSIE